MAAPSAARPGPARPVPGSVTTRAAAARQVALQRRGYAAAVLRALARNQRGRTTAQIRRTLRDSLTPLGLRLSPAALHQLATDIAGADLGRRLPGRGVCHRSEQPRTLAPAAQIGPSLRSGPPATQQLPAEQPGHRPRSDQNRAGPAPGPRCTQICGRITAGGGGCGGRSTSFSRAVAAQAVR